METLRKGVNILCAIYGLYALVSWLQLGTFVPPLPLKPFVYFILTILYGYYVVKEKQTTVLSLFSILWLLTLGLSHQSIPAFFSNYEMAKLYADYIAPILAVISFVAFLIFIFLLSRKLKSIFPIWGSALLIVIPLILFFVLQNDFPFYSYLIVFFGMFFFIYNKFSKHHVSEQAEIFLLNGVAVLILIDLFALG